MQSPGAHASLGSLPPPPSPRRSAPRRAQGRAPNSTAPGRQGAEGRKGSARSAAGLIRRAGLCLHMQIACLSHLVRL